MFEELLEKCLEEGRFKGLQAILRIYRGMERNEDPDVQDLDEALSMMLDYLGNIIKYWKENPDEKDWFATAENYQKVKDRYYAKEKALEQALKSSSSSGEKLIALDGVVDLMHNDCYVLEQISWGEEAHENTQFNKTIIKIIEILKKLGKFPKRAPEIETEYPQTLKQLRRKQRADRDKAKAAVGG